MLRIQNRFKIVIFLSFQLFEIVIYYFIRIHATFQMVHYNKRMFLTMKQKQRRVVADLRKSLLETIIQGLTIITEPFNNFLTHITSEFSAAKFQYTDHHQAIRSVSTI